MLLKRQLKITSEILYLSDRDKYISFFRREGSDELFVFEKSLAKLQEVYKTPLLTRTLKCSGVIYTTLTEGKLLSHVARADDHYVLVKTEWGYECCYSSQYSHSG